MLEENQIPYFEDIPSYVTFLSSHLRPNVPCIIGPALIEDWPALRDWVIDETPNWNFFLKKFGADEVTVADCSTSEFGDQCRETTTVSELISKLDDLEKRADIHHLYLKDWHLRLRHSGYSFYYTPEIFSDDWMNDYYINSRKSGGEIDDFRFVYLGFKGTFTPLHRDVYCSYSWSTNIFGCKKWTLFPPSVTAFLYGRGERHSLREQVFDVRSYDSLQFPSFSRAIAEAIVIIQKPQETIFVPSGWFHQVENVTDCISITAICRR